MALVAPATARRLLPILADTDGVLYRTYDDHYRMGEIDPADVAFPDAEQAAWSQRVRHRLERRAYHGGLDNSIEWKPAGNPAPDSYARAA